MNIFETPKDKQIKIYKGVLIFFPSWDKKKILEGQVKLGRLSCALRIRNKTRYDCYSQSLLRISIRGATHKFLDFEYNTQTDKSTII